MAFTPVHIRFFKKTLLNLSFKGDTKKRESVKDVPAAIGCQWAPPGPTTRKVPGSRVWWPPRPQTPLLWVEPWWSKRGFHQVKERAPGQATELCRNTSPSFRVLPSEPRPAKVLVRYEYWGGRKSWKWTQLFHLFYFIFVIYIVHNPGSNYFGHVFL